MANLEDLIRLGTHPELAKRQMQIWMPREVTYASRVVPAAQALDLPNGAAVNLASAELPVGQWSISGEVWFNITSGTPSVQQLAGAISATGGALPTDVDVGGGINLIEVNQSRSAGSQVGFVLPITPMFISVKCADHLLSDRLCELDRGRQYRRLWQDGRAHVYQPCMDRNLMAKNGKRAARVAVHQHEREKHPGEGLTRLNGKGNGSRGKAPKGPAKTKASLPAGYVKRQPGGGKRGSDRSTERLANKLAHRLDNR